MSLYTRQEFANLCGTTKAVVTTNINRNKIKLFDTKIDSENAVNKAFFLKYSKKNEAEIKQRNKPKPAKETINELYDKVVKRSKKEPKTSKHLTEQEEQRLKDLEEAEIVQSWELRKKKADTLLQERKAEKESMQLQKLGGKLLPTDLAVNIIRIHNQSIFATFQNDVENQASIFCDILAGGDRKLLGEITDKLGEQIGVCIKRAEEVAMQSIENAIDEYTDTRSRGERK